VRHEPNRMGNDDIRQAYRTARSVEEVTERNVRAIAALEQEAKDSLSATARFIGRITAFCGTVEFALLHVVFFAGWIAMNTVPGLPHVDPFPYTFLTLMVSLEAIFLSTFILITQNEETRLTERRNALDLQINLLTEQENTQMLHLLQCIANKVGVSDQADPAIAALEQATRPEVLAEQIDRLTQKR
jgi:uncharacterized membrane protein